MATLKIPTLSEINAHQSELRARKRTPPELFDERVRNKAMRGASDDVQASDARVPDDCLCAGVIPYDASGFWLCKMRSNNKEVWADFGGKRGPSDENAWATARRDRCWRREE